MSNKINTVVANRIQKYEENSEKLIAFSQLAFVVMMGILFIVSPKNIDAANTQLSPVLFALSVWLVVLVLRIILAYANLLRNFTIYLFIVVDMVLLVGLIGTYHLQYQASPGLSLQAPTFSFLVFFIALRVLRLRVRYIVVSTLAAVVCWTVLIVYAALNGEITNGFVTYVLSESVLIGAEVEKLMAVISCGLILAIGTHRSRKLLVYSQQSRTAVESLSHFFAPEVMRRISDESGELRPGKGERRHGAIMVVDLRRFSVYSSYNKPDTVMDTLSDYQSQLIPIFERHNGSVDKFMGDGILAHFGVTDQERDYAANALRAAENILKVIDAWNQKRITRGVTPLNIGIGIAVGSVMFGTVGDEHRLEFTVVGNPVNIATKLEKATKKYQSSLLCSYEAYELALKQGYRVTLSPYKAKNQTLEALDEPVDIVMLATPSEKKKIQKMKNDSHYYSNIS